MTAGCSSSNETDPLVASNSNDTTASLAPTEPEPSVAASDNAPSVAAPDPENAPAEPQSNGIVYESLEEWCAALVRDSALGTLIDTYGGDAYDLSVEPYAEYSPASEAKDLIPDATRQAGVCTMGGYPDWGFLVVTFVLADTPAHAASLYSVTADPTSVLQLSETSALSIRGAQEGLFGHQDFEEGSGATGDVLAGAATASVYATAFYDNPTEAEWRAAITSAIEWALANPPMVA